MDRIHILFYNTENLFDTSDDPATEDEEFLPEGDRHWTNFRFHTKLNHISKVLLATAGFEPPEIIGLCEVENRGVLEQLAKNTALKNYSYRIIHKDSPDERGIDVGLLYRSDRIQALTYHYIPLLNANHEVEKTREILHAEFLLAGDDTLHVFFNHWPSRYRGQAETEADRMLAATTLREAVLKVLSHTPGARIVIMGDFNDQPKDESLKSGLLATKKDDHAVQDELINLSYNWKQGTIKYRQTWSIFDQIIVSDGLLRNREWNTSAENAKVVDLPFLLEHDEKYQGKKLNRTYVGFNYHGGFSDHLPILLELDR
ncbi:MAG TPA: endonuclease/exonuclease/phosphatase family protein [Sunxiuqinia sp.]|nr:endonuclease/exonuclease/phosphatase family protein [Sunxiuqinia sp.]